MRSLFISFDAIFMLMHDDFHIRHIFQSEAYNKTVGSNITLECFAMNYVSRQKLMKKRQEKGANATKNKIEDGTQ